jgi:hypothetical protein
VKGINFIPYIRAYDYVNNTLVKTKKLYPKGVMLMNEALNDMRKNDPKQINLEGVVDFD